MRHKIGCKKCGAQNYSFYKIKKKNYRQCNECKNSIKMRPDKMAYALYSYFCEIEVNDKCKNLIYSPMYFRKIHNVRIKTKTEYKYLYENLRLLFEYFLFNDLMEKVKHVPAKSFVPIIINYKNPLQEADFQKIIDDLLKTVEEKE